MQSRANHARSVRLEHAQWSIRMAGCLCVFGCLALAPPGGTTCPTDLDGDGHVDARDLVILLGNWGMGGPGDIDGDGVVGGADLPWIFATWGGCWEAEDGTADRSGSV